MRNEEEKEWNDALTKYRSPWGSWQPSTRYPGCQLTGHVMVDKAPGELYLYADSYGHDIAAHMTNLSHIVHHFSFGELDTIQYVDEQQSPGVPSGFRKSLHPMDGNVYVTEQLHQAYHHYLRVIAMEFSNGHLFQLVRQKAQRVYRILQNSQLSMYRQNIVPGKAIFGIIMQAKHFFHFRGLSHLLCHLHLIEVKFSYDLSPITVSYLQVSQSWYDYLTGVLAIVGGVFTILGMMDTGLSSLSKKKSYSY